MDDKPAGKLMHIVGPRIATPVAAKNRQRLTLECLGWAVCGGNCSGWHWCKWPDGCPQTHRRSLRLRSMAKVLGPCWGHDGAEGTLRRSSFSGVMLALHHKQVHSRCDAPVERQ